jgi:phosphoribosyl-AMP cyclohydrolase
VSPDKDSAPLLSTLKWNADGLIPAIVQDATTGDVLMMAWMNEEALRRTLERRETVFYSRSRRRLWHKGETSGHIQAVASVHIDCDADAVLIKVHQRGGACHLGYRSCFFRRVNPAGELEIAGDLVFDAEVVYRTEGKPAAGAEQVHAHAEPSMA